MSGAAQLKLSLKKKIDSKHVFGVSSAIRMLLLNEKNKVQIPGDLDCEITTC